MKALIVYASLTGNTQEIAQKLGEKLEKLNIKTEVEECMNVYADEFKEMDICVVATYTYGTDGNLPDEILDFYDDLKELDLSNKVFAVLGSGQIFYEHFCRAVDYFEEAFLQTKAKKATESLKFELNLNAEEEYKLDRFAQEILEASQSLK